MDNSTKAGDGIRQILTDTIEVQLAANKATMAFFGDLTKVASSFSEVATQGLADIASGARSVDQVLVTVSEASLGYWRSLAESSEAASRRFNDELSKAGQANSKRSTGQGGGSATGTKRSSAKGKRTRRARAKE